MGALFFTIQIYGDFSGYSDIAIGCARLFGINLMQNFNYPYFSRDIAEFWRRWHISLTTWFRDYIYIPLGGSRVGKWKGFRNTMIIFLVSGFWHGANWTFIAWGAYHAFLFLPLFLSGKNRKYRNTVAEGKLLPSFKEVLQMGTTFLLVVIGWVFFRAETITQAFGYLRGMCDRSLLTVPKMPGIGITQIQAAITLLFMSILIIIEWIHRNKQFGLQIVLYNNIVLRWSIYLVLCFLIHLYSENHSQFIYFQF